MAHGIGSNTHSALSFYLLAFLNPLLFVVIQTSFRVYTEVFPLAYKMTIDPSFIHLITDP